MVRCIRVVVDSNCYERASRGGGGGGGGFEKAIFLFLHFFCFSDYCSVFGISLVSLGSFSVQIMYLCLVRKKKQYYFYLNLLFYFCDMYCRK